MDKKSIIGIAVVAVLFLGFAYFNSQQQKEYLEQKAAYEAYVDSVAAAARAAAPVADSLASGNGVQAEVAAAEAAAAVRERQVETLGEALLRPTVIYVKPVLRCIDAADVRGVSHITGGGFYENVPRCIPDGLCARIDKAAIRTPAVFGLLQAKGGIDEHDMFNTFNMGVGMIVVVSPETAEAALGALRAEGIDAYVCGEIVTGEEKICLC